MLHGPLVAPPCPDRPSPCRDGLPYCEADYHAKFGIRCDGCEKFITGRVLEVSGARWAGPLGALRGLPLCPARCSVVPRLPFLPAVCRPRPVPPPPGSLLGPLCVQSWSQCGWDLELDCFCLSLLAWDSRAGVGSEAGRGSGDCGAPMGGMEWSPGRRLNGGCRVGRFRCWQCWASAAGCPGHGCAPR